MIGRENRLLLRVRFPSSMSFVSSYVVDVTWCKVARRDGILRHGEGLTNEWNDAENDKKGNQQKETRFSEIERECYR